MRRACPKFLRQTFYEFARLSVADCEWAENYVAHYKAQKKNITGHPEGMPAISRRLSAAIHPEQSFETHPIPEGSQPFPDLHGGSDYSIHSGLGSIRVTKMRRDWACGILCCI